MLLKPRTRITEICWKPASLTFTSQNYVRQNSLVVCNFMFVIVTAGEKYRAQPGFEGLKNTGPALYH